MQESLKMCDLTPIYSCISVTVDVRETVTAGHQHEPMQAFRLVIPMMTLDMLERSF